MTVATSTPSRAHPAQVLLDAQGGALHLPVCDHYSGVEARMRKSLLLQAEMMDEFGTCVFDVTLDCEDGAPVGQEAAHARLVASLARGAAPGARVAARVHAVDHASFAQDLDIIVGEAGDRLCHLMLPKVESVDDVLLAERHLGRLGCRELPLHVLIESPAAVHRAFDIAAHPRVQSISFGLMDFVSAHGGAIPPRPWARLASSSIRSWFAPSWRSPPPAMPMAGAIALRGDRIQGSAGVAGCCHTGIAPARL